MALSGLDDSPLGVVPRNQWIKDEVSAADRKSEWPGEYQEPEKFIIHHSGGRRKDINRDGVISGKDYLLAAQSLYRWQSKVIDGGWADVGYNFIIAPDGKIYEGRYGRDGVIGGHVIRSAQCDKERFGGSGQKIGFNRGTIGIVLLGDFDYEAPTAAALESLAKAIAYKGLEFDISPAGTSFFTGLNLPNVIGHRDVDCSWCPGKNLYFKLSSVRQEAQKKYDVLRRSLISAGIRPRARLLYQSDKHIVIDAGEIKEIWADFKNEGNTTWHSYTKDTVYLADSAVKSRLASLDSMVLASVNGDTSPDPVTGLPYFAGSLVQPNVKPGETGTFKFKISAGAVTSGEKKYVLTWGNKGWFPGAELAIAVNSTAVDYAAELVSQQSPGGYFIGAPAQVKMSYKNNGAKTWPTDKLVMGVYGEGGASSDFQHDEWDTGFGGIEPRQKGDKAQIAPGETADFSFHIKGPVEPGNYNIIYRLEFSDKSEEIAGGRRDVFAKVDAPLAAEIVGHGMPPAVMAAWRPEVYLRVKNVGNIPWGRTFRLEALGDNGGKSQFAHPEWEEGRTIGCLDGDVMPGQTVTFSFKIKPPAKNGTYRQAYALKAGDQRVFVNGKYDFDFQTRVDGGIKPPPPPPKYVYHTVRRGEYLGLIAGKYGMSQSTIIKLNGIRNANKIYIGQKLKILK